MSRVVEAVRHLGAYGLFFKAVFVSTWRYGLRWERIVEEAWKLGWRSFPVLATMAVFVGTNLAIQGHASFKSLGAQSLVGMFVGLAGVREVCPLLAATMVAAKGGTELTAQLAVMRTNEQIDALEVMAVDPRSELVTPPLLAIIVVLPALTIISIALAIVASLLVAVHQLGMERGDFMLYLLDSISLFDITAATLKSAVFGAIIATVSGYFGFFSERGPKGVGEATNRAVVVMCIIVISVNFLLTSVLYG